MSLTPSQYVILDFETTGFDPSQAEIIEVAAIRVRGFEEIERFHSLIRPEGHIPLVITQITGISPEMVKDAPSLKETLERFIEFLGDDPIVAHNASMEQRFLDQLVSPHAGKSYEVHNSIDPLALIAADQASHSLENLRIWAGALNDDAHRADQDCIDLLKILRFAHEKLHRDQKHLLQIAQSFLCGPQFEEPWWWSWFFESEDEASGDLDTFFPRTEDLGDLKELKAHDEERDSEWKRKIPLPEIEKTLRDSAQGEIEYRETQNQMAQSIARTFNEGKRIAIEAPTGTGKSLAYLIPGVLGAKASESPLVVSTHSKSLQDQLLHKDIPLLRQLLHDESIKATTVKGQNNYFCLRKLHDLATGISPLAPPEERWSIAYLLALAWTGKNVEVERASRYLIGQFEPLDKMLDQVRSHHTTTQGPGCPFYKSCHFFNSARIAHQSDVIIANHSLVFQWPAHLPKIRQAVFDEAHHLEDQITEANSIHLREYEVSDTLNRLSRSSRGRKLNDLVQIQKALEKVSGEKDGVAKLEELVEKARARLTQLKTLIPLGLPSPGFEREAFEETIQLNPLGLPDSRRNSGIEEGIEGFRNLHVVLKDLFDLFSQALEESKKVFAKDDPALDITKLYYSRLERFIEALATLLDEEKKDLLRMVHWSRGENEWRIQVAPIEVSETAQLFFAEKRSVVLTSATLSAGKNKDFILSRIGFTEEGSNPGELLLTLPSPYALERQAQVYIPRDMANPGTPSHFESLVDFTEKTVTAIGGKTLVLFTSNRRLRAAAEILRERLTPRGYTVFDSLSDRRAAENFRNTKRAVLLGSERYGEGLDIQGEALSCVIIEKINEAMTRGPVAEARKARTKFALFDYDFPMRMIWLKQRVGRLIRGPKDRGAIVVFDPRYHAWSPSSRAIVNQALSPMPIYGGSRDQVIQKIEAAFTMS